MTKKTLTRYNSVCIKSRADALANLPNRARWSSRKGDAAIFGNETVARMSALHATAMEGFFMPATKRNMPSFYDLDLSDDHSLRVFRASAHSTANSAKR